MKKSHKALPNQQELVDMKPWGYLTPPENFELSEERRAQGWEQTDIPQAKELNQWQNEKDEQLKNILQALISMIGDSSPDLDEQALQDLFLSGGALRDAIQRLCMQSLQKDPKTHFKLSPIGTIYPYNNEFGEWQDNVTLPGWVSCTKRNSRNTYTTADGATHYVPILADTFTCGAGSPDEVGNTGGANEVTLTTAQMPKHKHSNRHYHSMDFPSETSTKIDRTFTRGVTSHTRPWHGRDQFNNYETLQDISYVGVKYGLVEPRIVGDTGAITTYNVSGESQAFDNQPPYYKVLYIVKIQDLEGPL